MALTKKLHVNNKQHCKHCLNETGSIKTWCWTKMISTPFAEIRKNNGLRRTKKRNQWHNANSLWKKKTLLTTAFWTNQQQLCIKQYFHEAKNSCCRSLHHAEDNLPDSPNKKMEVTWLACQEIQQEDRTCSLERAQTRRVDWGTDWLV